MDAEYYAGLAMDAFMERTFARASEQGMWTTKDGRQIPINTMTDSHLFNAYMKTRDEDLFEEMVLRLFKQRLGRK
jgi:hypothetical protein